MGMRLGLDLGSTSLGWCLLGFSGGSPSYIVDCGVRIFPDGRDDKSKEPLAVSRRNARAMRRNRDRKIQRKKNLMKYLIDVGILPKDLDERKQLQTLNPYQIRAEAVEKKVPLYSLGRALIHISQRRGFKSNRKLDGKENDLSSMKLAIRDLETKLGEKTLGQYLYDRLNNKYGTRINVSSVGNKIEYNLFPTRKMYSDEVDLILKTQRDFHASVLSDDVIETIKDILFFQRDLKKPDVGYCRLIDGEKRARLAYPEVHYFRILQEVNNLEFQRLKGDEPSLSTEQRRQIIDSLLMCKKMTFSKMRTVIRAGRSLKFNLESDNRKDLKGDEICALLSSEDTFGDRWHTLSASEKRGIVNLLMDEPNHAKLLQSLQEKWGLTPEQAHCVSTLSLPEGYGHLSLEAIHNLIPHLEKGMKYADACKAAGYHHSDFRTGEVFDQLPYYGEILKDSVIGGSFHSKDDDNKEKFYGKITNPTVHIVLNQVQKLVNSIIEIYGQPDEIVVELARDLKQKPDDYKKDQTKNTKDNERINKELESLGVQKSYKNRMLFKLWEDLNADPTKRVCPFSGKQIAVHDIFSGEFEEEHLLPFSRSFNDSRSNKVLAHRDWNRKKKNMSPYEAFGHLPQWDEIIARAENLPANKKWRFSEDAWSRIEGEDGVIARMLNDTRYMSRIVKKYLSAVFDNEKGKNKVWSAPGQITALLRHQWGLNSLIDEDTVEKNREDHRHHAIDAFVIACCDRSIIQKISRVAHDVIENHALWEQRQKLVLDFDEPFSNAREALREKVRNMVISYRPDHGNAQKAIQAKIPYTTGALHQDTCYGYIAKGVKKDTLLLATRKPVDSFLNAKNIGEIADMTLRNKLLSYVADIKEGSKEWKEALLKFSQDTGTKRLRVHIEKSNDVMIPVRQPHDKGPEKTRGQIYKYYQGGNNYCADIYEILHGQKAGDWGCEIISNYDAHQHGFTPQWKKDHPTAKRVMRLQINDMVAYEERNQTIHARVKKMTGVYVYLRPHNIAKEEADKLSWQASAKQLKLKNARKISVDILGHVKDPYKKKAS